MAVKLLLMSALFLNFFGFYIVEYFASFLGVYRLNIFVWNDYSAQSIWELLVVFFLCATTLFFISVPSVNIKQKSEFRFKQSFFYWIVTFSFFALGVAQLLSINLNFETSIRGIGQFDRNFLSALSRISLLVLPALILYRLGYQNVKLARLVTVLVVFSYSLNATSYGDRRIMIYYLLAFTLILLRERRVMSYMNKTLANKKMRQLFILFIAFVLLIILAYLIRAHNDPNWLGVNFLLIFMQSTFGALGIGAILSEVKMIIELQTGYLYGETFFIHFSSLFIPTALTVAFGGTEFVNRSSFLFNDLFNTNLNQGYDFMLVADYFWNFGYFGYILYVFNFMIVAFFTIKMIYSPRLLSFVFGSLVLIFFIAGQRSDFGLFFKSSIYTIVFAYFFYIMLVSQGKFRVKFGAMGK